MNFRVLIFTAAGMALGAMPASAQESVGSYLAAPPDASPAPEFLPSSRARLGVVIPTATNVPAWPEQIGPAAFVDRFEGPHLNQRWRPHDRKPNDWWAENNWRPENVKLDDAGLSLVMRKSDPGAPAPLSSGEINHLEKFRYGYFESRFKVPRGAGVITAFFTYVREDGTRKTWNEIDVEILGRDTRTVEFTIHVDGKSINRKIDLGFDAADDFHTYAFEWRPDSIRWYVDNKLAHQVTGYVVEKIRRPQMFHIDVWGTKRLYQWAGSLDPDAGPWALEISCMAYRPSYDGASLCAE